MSPKRPGMAPARRMKDGHELNDFSKSRLLACHALALHTNAIALRGQVGTSTGRQCAALSPVQQRHVPNGEEEGRAETRAYGEEEGEKDRGRREMVKGKGREEQGRNTLVFSKAKSLTL